MGILQKFFGMKQQKTDMEWQTLIVQEICAAMIRISPVDWKSYALVLEATDKGLGSGLRHSAITPTPVTDMTIRDENFITPDMEVIAVTRKLELAWIEHRCTFKRAIITAVEDENGNYIIRSDYEHND